MASAGFSVYAPNKLMCNFTGKCLETGNKTYLQSVSTRLKIVDMILLALKSFIFAESTKDMNIQARKLVLIEEFLRITDESLIAKLESFIKQEKIYHMRDNVETILTIEVLAKQFGFSTSHF